MNPLKRHALTLGMLLGLGLSMISLMEIPATPLPDKVAALAGNHVITQAEYERAVSGTEQDLRRSLSQAEKVKVLNTLIDEHLLLIYAEQNQLHRTVPLLRRQTVDYVLEGLRQQALTLEPDAAELKAFATDNARYFSISLTQDGEPDNWAKLQPLAMKEWQRRQAEKLLDELLTSLRESVTVTHITP